MILSYIELCKTEEMCWLFNRYCSKQHDFGSSHTSNFVWVYLAYIHVAQQKILKVVWECINKNNRAHHIRLLSWCPEEWHSLQKPAL